MRYVRVEFGGGEVIDNNDFKGLHIAACGSGTLLEYVQPQPTAVTVTITGRASSELHVTRRYGYASEQRVTPVVYALEDGARSREVYLDSGVWQLEAHAALARGARVGERHVVLVALLVLRLFLGVVVSARGLGGTLARTADRIRDRPW